MGQHVINCDFFPVRSWEHLQVPEKLSCSIHLCAIRYLMLVLNKLADKDSRSGDIRTHINTSWLHSVLPHINGGYFAPSYSVRSINCKQRWVVQWTRPCLQSIRRACVFAVVVSVFRRSISVYVNPTGSAQNTTYTKVTSYDDVARIRHQR